MQLFRFHTLLSVLGVSAIALCPLQAIAQSTNSPSNVVPASPDTDTSCLSGYPDGTYRGDQPVTRNEFAAGLNACLEQILRPLNQGGLATRSEFEATLQRQQELNEESRELSDALEPVPSSSDHQ
jgi:hypothetical protein